MFETKDKKKRKVRKEIQQTSIQKPKKKEDGLGTEEERKTIAGQGRVATMQKENTSVKIIAERQKEREEAS